MMIVRYTGVEERLVSFIKLFGGLSAVDIHDYLYRLNSSRAFGHIGQQLGVILNGQLQHLLSLEVDHLQILLESSAPRLLGAPCFTSAIRRSRGYCHFRRSMIW